MKKPNKPVFSVFSKKPKKPTTLIFNILNITKYIELYNNIIYILF